MKITLIKERLINRREQMNITKQQAARLMNMSQPAYLRYESGERMPSIHIIRTMADVLSTSVEYLTGTSNNPAPTSFNIRKDIEPELFNLIYEYRVTSSDCQKRLLEYCKKLNEKP